MSACAVDILFVLDASGVDRTNFDKQIRFVLDLLDILTIDPAIHLVASIVYDGHMRQKIQFSFTAYTNIQTLSTAVSGRSQGREEFALCSYEKCRCRFAFLRRGRCRWWRTYFGQTSFAGSQTKRASCYYCSDQWY